MKKIILFIIFVFFLTTNTYSQSWEDIGSSDVDANSVGSLSFTIDSNNIPYIAYVDRNSFHITVKKLVNNNWVLVGEPKFVKASNYDKVQIRTDNTGIPYIYINQYKEGTYDSKISVLKFDGYSWDYVGKPKFAYGYYSFISKRALAFDHQNIPYVAFYDNKNGQKLSIMKFNGVSWETVGGGPVTTFASTSFSIGFNSSGVLYAAYTDSVWLQYMSVKKFNGSTWEQVGDRGFSGENAGQDYNIRFDSNDTPIVAYKNFTSRVKSFDGTNWNDVGTQPIVPSVVNDMDLEIDNNNFPVIAFTENDTNHKVSVLKYNGSSWEYLGGSTGISAGISHKIDIHVDSNNTIFLSYISNKKIYVKSYRITPTFQSSTFNSVTSTSATILGEITSSNGLTINEKGFVYSFKDNSPGLGKDAVFKQKKGNGTGTFSHTLENLIPNTTYYFRAYSKNNNVEEYGEVTSFKTSSSTTLASITRKSPASKVTDKNEVVYRATFGTNVINVDASDFHLSGTVTAKISSITEVSKSIYDINVNDLKGNGRLELKAKGIDNAIGANDITTFPSVNSEVITVSQLESDDYLNQQKIGQTFKATTSNYLTSVTFFKEDGQHNSGSNVDLKIYSGEENNGGIEIYSQKIYLDNSTDTNGQNFILEVPQKLTQGNTYSIVLSNFTSAHALSAYTLNNYTDGHVIFTGYNSSIHDELDLKIKIFEGTINSGSNISSTTPTVKEFYIYEPTHKDNNTTEITFDFDSNLTGENTHTRTQTVNSKTFVITGKDNNVHTAFEVAGSYVDSDGSNGDKAINLNHSETEAVIKLENNEPFSLVSFKTKTWQVKQLTLTSSKGSISFNTINSNGANTYTHFKSTDVNTNVLDDITSFTISSTDNINSLPLDDFVFKFKSAPNITTKNPSLVSEISATVGGRIESDNGSSIIEKGILYSYINTIPKIDEENIIKSINADSGTTFSNNIISLTPNKTYYYRAYAINAKGIGYGEVKKIRYNSSLHFDGDNDRITISDSNLFNYSNGFTLETWVKSNFENVSSIASQFHNLDKSFHVVLLDSGKIEFLISNNGTTDNYIVSETPLIADQWTHIACTYDGTDLKIYINGKLNKSGVGSNNIHDSNNPIEIGSRGGILNYNGYLDEFKIWNHALTSSELLERKEGTIPPHTKGLLAYYNFNQGVIEGDNTTITTLLDRTNNNLHGTLENFTKTGTSSNFVSGLTNDSFSETYLLENKFATSGNWSTASNWSLGAVPTQTDKAIIENGKTVTIDIDDLKTDDFIVESGATLSIPKNKEITIQNAFSSSGTLELSSDTTDSGVLLIEGTSTGTVTYKRGGLLANKWSIITPPIVGQKIKDFADAAANDIRRNTSVTPNRYAIGYYDDSQVAGSKWVYYDADVDANLEFEAGKSYAISRNTDGEVSFTGALTIATITKTLTTNLWVAIGNPFTTYFPANKNSNSSFLNDNLAALDDIYQSLYVWDNSQNKYVAVSEVDATDRSLTPGQGFFVKLKNGQTDITFNKEKRSTKPATGSNNFGKTNNTTPTIELRLTDGTTTVVTSVKYFDTATSGFDKGYDIGNFNSSELDVYSRLVNNENETNFTIQSLPKGTYENMIIPIGVITKADKELSFTLTKENLPNNYNVYLEDKVLNIFKRLDEENSSYKITLTENKNSIGRFYLHVKPQVLSVDEIHASSLQIYLSNKRTLTVLGLNNEKATVKVISILGKELLSKNITSNNIELPKSLKGGIYIIKIKSNKGNTTKKIILE